MKTLFWKTEVPDDFLVNETTEADIVIETKRDDGLNYYTTYYHTEYDSKPFNNECEWKFDEYGFGTSNCDANMFKSDMINHKSIEFIYCPYCGHKIKKI
jgi:hypothetical protein